MTDEIAPDTETERTRFRVVVADHREYQVVAVEVVTATNGALVFRDDDEAVRTVFAAGQWIFWHRLYDDE